MRWFHHFSFESLKHFSMSQVCFFSAKCTHMLHALLNYSRKVCSPYALLRWSVVKLVKLYAQLTFLTMKVPSLSISIGSKKETLVWPKLELFTSWTEVCIYYMGHRSHQSQTFWKRHGWKEAKRSRICMNPLNIPQYNHIPHFCFQNLTSVSDVTIDSNYVWDGYSHS